MRSDDLYNLSMVFERTHGWHFSEVTLTHRMLCILALLNGKLLNRLPEQNKGAIVGLHLM
jgi:hypothetical protein